MKIKLKKLHAKLDHVCSGVGHYHDSSKSLYAYKEYRIKTDDSYMGWYVCRENGENLNESIIGGMTFKEAREWLENHLDKLAQESERRK